MSAHQRIRLRALEALVAKPNLSARELAAILWPKFIDTGKSRAKAEHGAQLLLDELRRDHGIGT